MLASNRCCCGANPSFISVDEKPSYLTRWWRERVIGLIVAQFTQGVTPRKIALTIALGLALGVFPILGATTVLCGVAGVSLKLNQPVIQFVNWAVTSLQLALIIAFVRIGEWITSAQRVSFSVPELIKKFHESPAAFFREFGITGLHGILAWTLIAPGLIAIAYLALVPPLTRLWRIKIATAPPANAD